MHGDEETVIPRKGVDAGQLFRSHGAFVARFATRMGASRSDLEDVVQEVFMIAHRRGGFVPGAARPTTWLAEITRRVLSNRRRRKTLTGERVQADAATHPQPGPAEAAASREALGRVQAALDALDLRRRSVFVLYEIEGESCDAIAAGLGIPVGTVYSRLNKARAEFLAAYRALTGEPGTVVPFRQAGLRSVG